MPFGAKGLAAAKRYLITDSLNGKMIAVQAVSPLTAFDATVPPDRVGGYLVGPSPATVIPPERQTKTP